MSEQAATVYVRGRKAFVDSESRTVDGFWIGAGPCAVAQVASSDSMAALLLDALALSRIEVPTPPPEENLGGPLLELAGVRSFATFMKGAIAVRATKVDEVITLTPMRNLGHRQGFDFKDEEALSTTNEAQLSTLLQTALDHAE